MLEAEERREGFVVEEVVLKGESRSDAEPRAAVMVDRSRPNMVRYWKCQPKEELIGLSAVVR